MYLSMNKSYITVFLRLFIDKGTKFVRIFLRRCDSSLENIYNNYRLPSHKNVPTEQ